MRRILILLAAAAPLLLAVPPLFAAPAHDVMLTFGGSQLGRAPLPAGPAAGPALAVSHTISRLYVLPSGMVIAATLEQGLPERTFLNELRPDGSLRLIAELPADLGYESQLLLDMAADRRGRFYLLVLNTNFSAPSSLTRLLEVDRETMQLISARNAIGIYGIATAPRGLWAIYGQGIVPFEPDSGDIGSPVADLSDFGGVSDLDADSSGRLYFHSELVCSPPCPSIGTVDPAIGLAEPAPLALYSQVGFTLRALAIDRRCEEGATTRCLGGGRFRAEISYRAYDGAAGLARVTAAGSRDTGVFSFFDADNWELMVKVLDGCAINSHFWVYAAASTDVEFTMSITDSQTGARQVYSNPLGRVAETITDNQAFSCGSP